MGCVLSVKIMLKRAVLIIFLSLSLLMMSGRWALIQAQTENPGSTPAPAPVQTEPVSASSPQFHQAEVLEVVTTEHTEIGGYPETYQKVRLSLTGNRVVEAEYVLPLGAGDERLLKAQQQVVVAEQQMGDNTLFTVTDFYRLPNLWFVLGIFVLLIVVFSGLRGVTALAGLGFSIWLLLYYVVPSIAHGADPMTVSLVFGGDCRYFSLFSSWLQSPHHFIPSQYLNYLVFSRGGGH